MSILLVRIQSKNPKASNDFLNLYYLPIVTVGQQLISPQTLSKTGIAGSELCLDDAQPHLEELGTIRKALGVHSCLYQIE